MYNMPRQYPFMFNPQMYNMLPYMFWYAPQMMYPPMFPIVVELKKVRK